MIPLIKWELRQRRWFIIWWTVGIVLVILLNLSVYPSFKDQAAELEQSLSQMPESVKQLFSDTGDFISPVGYLSSQVFYMMLPMLFSIMSISLGSSLIAREEQEHTLELVLSRPLSRTRFIAGKVLAGILILAFASGITAIVTAISVRVFGFDGISVKYTLLATLVSVILSLLFGAISFTLTAMGHGARLASVGIASLFALGGYIISSLDSTVRWLRYPAKLFPYHYYRPSDILNGNFTTREVAGMLAAIAALGVISWIAFRRRDLD